MALYYAIDRFDGADWVVLEDEQGRTLRVPRTWVPTDSREGSVVSIEATTQESVTDLRLAIDADATSKRMREADHQREQLQRGPKGDVSL